MGIMKHLIESIVKRKPVVVWNPFKENDALTRSEFIALVKVSGYETLEYDGQWITAYQKGIKRFGYETIQQDLVEARVKQLRIYQSILEDDILVHTSIEKRYIR
jgi:hypothetical protein